MTPREHAVETLKTSRRALNDLLDGFPDDKATYQPTPAVNHALWIAGRLALTDDRYASKLDGQPRSLPAIYADLFGASASLKPGDAYPPFRETRANLKAARMRLHAAIRDTSAEKLDEEDSELGTNLLGGLFALACHEAWHSGRLGILRRSLNLPSIYTHAPHGSVAQQTDAARDS